MTSEPLPGLALPPIHPPPGPTAAAIATRPQAGARGLLLLTLALALAILAWEAAGADRWLADLAGSTQGFAWRQHWLLTTVLHTGGRLFAWAAALLLCLGVWWPQGPLRRLGLAQRLQLASGVLLSVVAVAAIKAGNPAACPWSLAAYGGTAQPVSHWVLWLVPAGGRGGCFPAGHASAGFAFLGGWFVFRTAAPALARRWLLLAIAAGLLLGLSQQWRGAHFMSHTLWSGWLCWCLAWAFDSACRRMPQSPSMAGEA